MISEQAKRTVLILYAPIGSGHMRAAEALREQLLQNPELDVVMGNIFNFVPSFFCRGLLGTYFFLLRQLPFGYDFMYKWGDTQGSLFLRSFVNRLFYFKGKELLEQIRPDAAIATHVTPAGLVALYKRETGDDLPLFGVVTDYSMHEWWLYDEIDVYNVFDKKIFANYLANLNEKQQLWELGIPIHDEFKSATAEKKMVLRRKHALPEDSFICLLSGGGEGLLPMREIMQACGRDANSKVYFVAICGRNDSLKKNLTELNLNNISVLGYTDEMADYMKAADVLVSKAGGVTVTEAVALNLPVVLYKPLPGQEYVNTKYLLDKGLVLQADDVDALEEIIEQAAVEKDFFAQLKEQQKTLSKPRAAENFVKKFNEFLGWFA